MDASEGKAALTEPFPREAWVGTRPSAENVPGSWQYWALLLAKLGAVGLLQASAGVACAVCPSGAEWSDRKLEFSPWEADWVAFREAPETPGPGLSVAQHR